jgi:hypothetical protein
VSVIPELENALIAAADRQSVTRFRAGLSRRKLTTVAVVLAVLAGGAVAGAASGLFEIGTRVSTPAQTGDDLKYDSDWTIVATGHAPEAGRWQMTAASSSSGYCLGIEFIDQRPPGAERGVVSEGCGISEGFDAVVSKSPKELLVYGPAPEEADAVRITAEGGFRREQRTFDGPEGMDGNFYLLVAPGDLHGAEIAWLDAEGASTAPPLAVPGTGRPTDRRPAGGSPD